MIALRIAFGQPRRAASLLGVLAALLVVACVVVLVWPTAVPGRSRAEQADDLARDLADAHLPFERAGVAEELLPHRRADDAGRASAADFAIEELAVRLRDILRRDGAETAKRA